MSHKLPGLAAARGTTSVDEVARRSNVSSVWIQRAELGNNVDVHDSQKIADALSTNLAGLGKQESGQ